MQDKDKVELAGIKKKFIRFIKGKQHGISSMYNIRFDPDLGVCRATVRRIPCVCSFCIE